MARKTKEDAEITRGRLLDAAEQVFYERGVSGASLADVAQCAGLTRGAVYLHFKDKLDLFDAMLQRVTLPIEQGLLLDGAAAKTAPITRILERFALIAQVVSEDARVRRVFELAMFKVEHVGDLAAVQQRWVRGVDRCIALLEQDLLAAQQACAQPLPLPVGLAAKGLQALFDGLLHAWLLRGGQGSLCEETQQLARFYLQSLGLSAEK